MKWRLLVAIGLAVSLLAVLNPASAQNTSATLRGTVRDRQGSVISRANVTVLNPATGVKHTAVTNKTGDYVVPELPPATYTVQIQATGFQSAILPALC